MRAGQEMLRQGLLLRTEWRDEEAIRYFDEAIIQDPLYAPAYAGKAFAYAMLVNFEYLAPRVAMPALQTAAAGDLALLFFTSGSTDEPKGVRIGHGCLEFLAGKGDDVWAIGTKGDDGRDGWQPSFRGAAARLGADFAQPKRQTLSSGASGRILARAISGTTVRSAKVEVPMK